jgi:hypothetical protein
MSDILGRAMAFLGRILGGSRDVGTRRPDRPAPPDQSLVSSEDPSRRQPPTDHGPQTIDTPRA